MTALKLVALDPQDLAIISAHLQDAVLKIGDMVFQPKAQRFTLIANRFDWEAAHANGGRPKQGFERRQAALRFERVGAAKVQNVPLDAKGDVLELLAIQFDTSDEPAGVVTLVFAGGGAVRLEVECVEAELRDLGPSWRTRSQPRHADGEEKSAPRPGTRPAGDHSM
ncbi:MAG: DUF2948 family protein [Hyphomicrobiaceae bacterium]